MYNGMDVKSRFFFIILHRNPFAIDSFPTNQYQIIETFDTYSIQLMYLQLKPIETYKSPSIRWWDIFSYATYAEHNHIQPKSIVSFMHF